MKDATPGSLSAGDINNSTAVAIGHGAMAVSYQFAPRQPVDAAELAAAANCFSLLPVESASEPAPLPAGSRLPFALNPQFVGRRAELRALAAAIKEGRAAAVTGAGGMGKTQLASEFAHRYGQFFAGGVFWLSFADPVGIPVEVAACGGVGALDLRPDFATLSPEEQVGHVLGAWQNPLPRLLIFDNCESEALLAQWRPPTGGSRVLVTSRRQEWDSQLGVSILQLGVLAHHESVTLLRHRRPDLPADDPDLVAIATFLGDLPLAIHLAEGFLYQYRRVRTPGAYLAQLRAAPIRDRSLSGEGTNFATHHVQSVERTFAVSYEDLDGRNPIDAVALALLARAACFAPGEPIPYALLMATLKSADDNGAVPLEAEDALYRLGDLGLLEQVSDTALRMHRLIGEFIRQMAADPNATLAVERALARSYERIRASMKGTPERTTILTELVARMRGFAAHNDYTSDDARRLFNVNSPGARILSLAILDHRPDPTCLDILEQTIRGSRSAFEQYHAMLSAATLVPSLDEDQRTRLQEVLHDEVSNARYITAGDNRALLRSHIMLTMGSQRQSDATADSGVPRFLGRGTVVRDYHILGPLKPGRTGSPYLAWMPRNERKVAIWEIQPAVEEAASVQAGPGWSPQLRHGLVHPNLLRIEDYLFDGDARYIVSEVVAQDDLGDRIARDAPLPPDLVMRLLMPIAQALDEAHGHGVVHGDVKPENILFRPDGTPVIAGLAPEAGSPVWTPKYIAPEQAFGPRGTMVGPWSDCYSLAVIAYQMLTGRVPFSAATPDAVLVAHLHKPVPPPRLFNPTLGVRTERALLRGLAKNSGERYPSASSFVAALAA